MKSAATVSLSILLAVTAGAALRLPRLGGGPQSRFFGIGGPVRPMHTDEAVHTLKFADLWQEGQYVYDPHDFHGPTLYYATLPAVWISRARGFARTVEATYRVVPAFFGIGLILLTVLLADGIGRGAVAAAAALAALSPAMAFYSRYYIQETLLVFFTFAAIAAGWRYARSGRIAWAAVCGASLGLMHATKETSAIAIACMPVALLGAMAWGRAKRTTPNKKRIAGRSRIMACVVALLVAVLVSVALYSVLFRNWDNVAKSVTTYLFYSTRAGGAGHEKPWHYYLQMLAWSSQAGGFHWSEGLILLLGGVGLLAGVFGVGIEKRGLGLVRFLAIYTLALTAAYSAIPYKTPWCALGFLHGWVLLAGVGAAALFRLVAWAPGRAALAALLLVGLGQLGWQAYRASFVACADPGNPYVYAHTRPDVLNMVNDVHALAAVSPRGDDMPVAVIGPTDDQWPLPWYLRRMSRVGYWTEPPADLDFPVVVASAELIETLDARIGPTHQMVRLAELRPEVFLALYVRADLWAAHVERLNAARKATRRGGGP